MSSPRVTATYLSEDATNGKTPLVEVDHLKLFFPIRRESSSSARWPASTP